MSKKRLYLIQRLEALLERNEEFYDSHSDLKNTLIAKINMLKLYHEIGVEDNDD